MLTNATTIAASLSTLLPLTPTPSLVGLAINYTLLMPIYLNWVVKLLADMEMYIGSVERIAYYTETQEKLEDIEENDEEHKDKVEEKKFQQRHDDKDVENIEVTTIFSGSNNNKENIEDIASKTLTSTKLPSESSIASPDNNDKCLNLTTNNKTTDNNVDTTIPASTGDDNGHHHHHHHSQHPQVTNDGHIAAVTTKTFTNKQEQTTGVEETKCGSKATKCDDTNDKKTIATATAKTSNKNKKNSTSATASNMNISSKLLERNDAERRASVKRLAKYKKQCK